jgi:hypothetical protein
MPRNPEPELRNYTGNILLERKANVVVKSRAKIPSPNTRYFFPYIILGFCELFVATPLFRGTVAFQVATHLRSDRVGRGPGGDGSILEPGTAE